MWEVLIKQKFSFRNYEKFIKKIYLKKSVYNENFSYEHDQ